jgi:DNA-binding CsgD family transcriptional regulator/tetratricopeptide (TPR) repeat protein
VARTLVSPDLVGRETQVGQLLGALSRAKAGAPSTVLVQGEAGSGKSRLLREFLSLARDNGATTLYGACIDVSVGDLPFVPFRTALRHLVQDRSAPETEALLGSTWRNLHVLLPELAPAAGPLDQVGNATPHVFEVVAAVIGALLRDRSVVLAIDDAQWADQSTLQLLRYLIQDGHPLSLLVVVSYRREEPPLDSARRTAFEELSRAADEVVDVSPLDGDQVTELVRRIGIELSTTSMARLKARCAGLPFLIEELVAAEHDGLTRGIPRRVRDVVRLRLGALSRDAQLLVALVAIAARPLRHRVLQEAAQLPSRDFAEALDGALSANLLVADTRDRTYGFRHDVAREIVHDDLLTASRLELHVRLAVALQSDLPVDAYASRLCEVAHHWLQTEAHEEHALRSGYLAARASTRAHAHPEALRQYEHVLRLWSRVSDPEVILGADLVAVSTDAAEASRWAGNTAAAIRHIDRAIEALADVGDDALLAVLHARRAHYTWLDTGHLARALVLPHRLGFAATRERVRASELMQEGQYAQSVDVARSAVDLARAAGATGDEIRANIILGVGLSFSGRPDIGIATIESAIQQAIREGSDEEVIAGHINLTFALLNDGQMEAAARVAQDGMLEAAARGTAGSDGALLAANAGEALTRLGRLSEAESVVERGMDTRLPPAVASVLLLARAELDVLRGRFAEAIAHLNAISDHALLDDDQFQQQMRAVEAELQMWNPSAVRTPVLGNLRIGLGSAVAEGVGAEDVPLAARLLWLGVRADAEGRALAEMSGDAERLRELVSDGRRLTARAAALTSDTVAAGARRQLETFLLLIEGEMSRLRADPDPRPWEQAAIVAESDPYLSGYAIWRHGAALRELRRRREAGRAFRQAYRKAHGSEMRPLADAVASAGLSLGIRVGEDDPEHLPRQGAHHPFNLTAREVEVLALLVQGLTNRRIASALRMTEKTASVHVSHILAKLSVNSRGEAVARAYEVGLARHAVSTGD